jgi:hypothetical protein
MSVNLDPRPGDPFPVTTHLLQKITELERENAALKKAIDRLEQKFAVIDAKSDKTDTSTRKRPIYQT